MKAKIVLKSGEEYDCEISKNMNELKLTFSNEEYVPWEILRTGNFITDIQVKEDNIGCGECSTCLTPIC